ncbi:unnamed protein product [Spirodela intermedia]|uniref:Uncharacterized protein n=2 Tax=Spirodela intermedia TaxID=51605 RepID=A0A7I8J5U9_SPIIN|nr:unnamed protein product [Spirodela intermedia]CAA6665461.1 unnamed protein product [Spirodela intermedia]CAA7402199.1 unnamed protein product [Spirodela intermedia]
MMTHFTLVCHSLATSRWPTDCGVRSVVDKSLLS